MLTLFSSCRNDHKHVSATMYFKVVCHTTTWSPGLTIVSHKKFLQSTPGKLLTAFEGKVAELEIKTQLFFS